MKYNFKFLTEGSINNCLEDFILYLDMEFDTLCKYKEVLKERDFDDIIKKRIGEYDDMVNSFKLIYPVVPGEIYSRVKKIKDLIYVSMDEEDEW